MHSLRPGDKVVKICKTTDTHDRLIQFHKKESEEISKFVQSVIDKKPFGDHPFYLHVIDKSMQGGKNLIWHPRLTKPKASPNTRLYKVYPNSEKVRIIWHIPREEIWHIFEKGTMTESELEVCSIYDYKYFREKLERPEPDDLDDETIQAIYREIYLSNQALKRAGESSSEKNEEKTVAQNMNPLTEPADFLQHCRDNFPIQHDSD